MVYAGLPKDEITMIALTNPDIAIDYTDHGNDELLHAFGIDLNS